MQPFKVILAETIQDGVSVPVATAHSINLNFDNGGIPRGDGNGLSDGNINITGKESLLLADGNTRESNTQVFNIRLKELETVIANLTAQAQANPNDAAVAKAKNDAQAKFNIWSTFLGSVQSALDVAMKAQYELDQQTD